MPTSNSHHSRSSGLGYGQVASSLLLIFPLFLAYEIGLLLTPAKSGVDFLSRRLFEALGRDSSAYLNLHLALGAGYLLLLTILWRRNSLFLRGVGTMLLESSIYALTLGSFIIFVMDGLVGLEIMALGYPRLSMWSPELGNALVISLGAGVHEELIFRLGMMGASGFILIRLGVSRSLAIVCAALLSSALFAMAHHVGANADAFDMSLLVYRGIAGLAFAAIFYYRSLAHAVYCHFLYDFYVMALA